MHGHMRLNSTATSFQTLDAILPAGSREDRHITFIDGERDQRKLSFAELRSRALVQLAVLQQRDVKPGDEVILFLADNERFLEVFWACLLGGIVPVPLAPGNTDEHWRKLLLVFAQLDRGWLCIDAPALERLEGFVAKHTDAAEWHRLRLRTWVPGGAVDSETKGTPALLEPEQTAFIQFSSGSTGQPKGVVLTHRNLATNIAAIRVASGFTDQDTVLSWMPLSHDMGLIGFHLSMLASGISHAIMRTELFARRPLLWLDLASQQRVSVLCSPNFGYQHYLKQYDAKQPQGLDLSSVRLIFNGAEPISAELCRHFLGSLAPHGLRPNAMLTVYGLAEASLAVAFPAVGEPMQTIWLDRAHLQVGDRAEARSPDAASAIEFVKLGKAVPGTEFRIVDDSGAPCSDGAVGHVHIRGGNVTQGYYRNEEATARARFPDGWLDTGDLGLVDDGQLVITGRAKDLIIVHGQNYYPHDIERIAESVAGIDGNRVVAASVRRDGTQVEELAVFLLHRAGTDSWAQKSRDVREAVSRETGLDIRYVVPVARIPKTTSGKLQRYLLVRDFEAGAFDAALAELQPVEPSGTPTVERVDGLPVVDQLLRICASVVPDRELTEDTNLLEIHLSSLTLARIHEAIEREFPGRIDVEDLLAHPSMRELARRMEASLA